MPEKADAPSTRLGDLWGRRDRAYVPQAEGEEKWAVTLENKADSFSWQLMGAKAPSMRVGMARTLQVEESSLRA